MTGENKKEQELRVKVATLLGVEQPIHMNMDNIRIGGKNKGTMFCNIPDYPNDLQAAKELIDWLALRGWRFCFLQHGDRRVKWVASAQKLNLHHQIESSSLAVAICEVFVKTMEGAK